MDWTEVLAGQDENPRAWLAAELLASAAYGSTAARVKAFVEQGGGCRATFFNYIPYVFEHITPVMWRSSLCGAWPHTCLSLGQDQAGTQHNPRRASGRRSLEPIVGPAANPCPAAANHHLAGRCLSAYTDYPFVRPAKQLRPVAAIFQAR